MAGQQGHRQRCHINVPERSRCGADNMNDRGPAHGSMSDGNGATWFAAAIFEPDTHTIEQCRPVLAAVRCCSGLGKPGRQCRGLLSLNVGEATASPTAIV